jgi:hypothetical protein
VTKLTRFMKRQLEQMALAGGVAFLGGLAVPNGSITKAVLSSAIAAGLRAVYGAFVRSVGDDPESPSIH